MFPVSEAVHMGVEAVGATQMMCAGADLLTGETVLGVAGHGTKPVGRYRHMVEVNLTDILAFNDDIQVVLVYVEFKFIFIVIVESGEIDFVDALLDGRNPHHGR